MINIEFTYRSDGDGPTGLHISYQPRPDIFWDTALENILRDTDWEKLFQDLIKSELDDWGYEGRDWLGEYERLYDKMEGFIVHLRTPKTPVYWPDWSLGRKYGSDKFIWHISLEW